MKYALSISAALLLLAVGQSAPAQAQSPRELVNQAIAAEGGLDALRGLKGLAIKADAMHWEPGQSKTADGEPRMLGNTTLYDHLGPRQRHGAHPMGSRHEISSG